MKLFFSVLILISTIAFAQNGAQVVATVGSKKITLDEFNKKYKRLYNPCKSHSFEIQEMSNFKNSDGNIHCLWCGILFQK